MNMVVDTSVRVAHFRRRDDHLVTLLEASLVVGHPHVIAEIACGTPPDRRAVISLLSGLDSAPVAAHAEVLQLIEARALHGRGCGLVDLS